MNTPFALLGAAIAFWGWQTAEWLVATLCILLVEGARFVPRRWDFKPEQLSRISDLCVVLAGVLFAGCYATLGNPRAITQLFLWLPLTMLPLALAQAYGMHHDIEVGVLFWSMRRVSQRKPTHVNIGYVYAAAWVLAASAANQRDSFFELGAMALAAWALWRVRPRSRPLGGWLLLLALAFGLSYAGHNGLRNAQLWLEANAFDWLRGDGGSSTDPYRAETNIGHIGGLKQSERIVMRVRTQGVLLKPLLLHRASYVTYTGFRWLAKSASFAPVVPGDNASVWPLEPEGEGASMQSASIVEQTDSGNPVLSLPAGTRRVEGLFATEMKRNTFGAVQVEHSPGFIAYRALYVQGASQAAAPTADDLVVPQREVEALQWVGEMLGLETTAPADAVKKVERYFADNFSYSLYRPDERFLRTPVTDFLLRTHAGHCEYFATATVLLLRAAGIPARYATGYSVQEWSDFESAYLVRERHAHAWARAFIDGAWRDVDTTPASWSAIEAQATPWSTRIADLVSWLRLKFSELRSREADMPREWIAVGALLVLWIVWRAFGHPARATRRAAMPKASDPVRVPGADSAFYRIEAFLAERCSKRASGETMREWLARIGPQLSQLPDHEELAALMELHYRFRFDPAGVPASEGLQFSTRVDAWLMCADTSAA